MGKKGAYLANQSKHVRKPHPQGNIDPGTMSTRQPYHSYEKSLPTTDIHS
ncbi:hypothetical protein KP509_10G039100 [Ceratopteris richardii]|uniref:Uncharacterized protein n=1 Tax=Ceratopteris richardii TaxID=49495 RepID=A0A8T2U0H2_CERRI|nr:hypothetical protein KP509_10G039100 [Ceratopteris richardii]